MKQQALSRKWNISFFHQSKKLVKRLKLTSCCCNYLLFFTFASLLVCNALYNNFTHITSSTFMGSFLWSSLELPIVSSGFSNATAIAVGSGFAAISPSSVSNHVESVAVKLKNGQVIGHRTESGDPPTKASNPLQNASPERNGGHLEEDPCFGKYIFIHKLPRKFNYGLLDDCKTLSYHMKDMCVHLQNDGFGPLVFENSTTREGDFKAGSWFATDQFTLEVIFHSRMRQYKCLTNDFWNANALFVPFYAALEAGKVIEGQNTTVRDKVPIELMTYLSSLKEWKVMGGRDHFFVAGRISWDFRRFEDNDSYWGNKLMTLPQAKHITMLTIEATTYHKNEMGIPYPTYFHPSSSEEVHQWQKAVARKKRKYLFAFAGAPRQWQNSIRNELINQCSAATGECVLINCRDMTDKKCHSPLKVIKLFRNSKFCLQPPGDSPTRRSTFDSIISGCIPVFFDLKSGPQQYIWHFQRNYSHYSVYIPQEDVKANKTDIRKVLSSIPATKVKKMRSEVIKMIPKVTYSNHQKPELDKMERDAFDIAVEGILNRVKTVKREFYRGKESGS